VAVLDVHGEWHVLSWEGVTWIALHAPDEKARCLARQLLLGGSNVRSDSADTRCTGDWGNFMRILSGRGGDRAHRPDRALRVAEHRRVVIGRPQAIAHDERGDTGAGQPVRDVAALLPPGRRTSC
jgi:hypothetical protein